MLNGPSAYSLFAQSAEKRCMTYAVEARQMSESVLFVQTCNRRVHKQNRKCVRCDVNQLNNTRSRKATASASTMAQFAVQVEQ